MVAFVCLACNNNGSTEHSESIKEPLFNLMASDLTKIHFINKVVDTEKFNILTYRNFYNGGGVAIGDINNDSLPDIYFTANQEENKLYLNKGNFVFEDITEKAGVAGSKEWSTGVAMADVNGDGFLDIYVCNAGDVDSASRENELFINNGDLTFKDQAKKYNLNNQGYSTHAAFFDFDIDGDLDCYILNNSFKDAGKIELYKSMRAQPDPGGDKLMRNDGGVFTDVTVDAGIYSSEIGFGLGVSVADLNHDFLPDLYISNDFWERDYLYINLGKGKFSEELPTRIDYCSVSSMGADVADLNNDGSPEIFSTDMLPGDNYHLKTAVDFDPYHLEDLKYRANFHYQMIQNCLHLNDGNANFQEIALLSGVSATDWSWGALLFDFENDGWKDIFVSNGIAKDVMSLDFRDFLANTEKNLTGVKALNNLSIIDRMPSRPLTNFAFSNSGTLKFIDNTAAFGLKDSSFSNGAAYGDLDNDGDSDLVVNNVNAPVFVYRNEANSLLKNRYLKIKFNGPEHNRYGIGTKVSLKTKDGIQVLENFNTRGFQSSIEPNLLFGLNSSDTIDTLRITWPDKKEQIIVGVESNQTLFVEYSDAGTRPAPPKEKATTLFKEISKEAILEGARHYENRFNDFNQEVLLTKMLSTESPRLISGDVNNDRLEDFILLGAKGYPDKLFLQDRNNKFKIKQNQSFTNDAGFESTCGALFDHDLDGDLDLMIGSGGNELQDDKLNFIVRFYKNDGKGNFSPDSDHLPPCIGNFSTLEATDMDGDGDVDIFLGARVVPGNYGLSPRSFFFKNDQGMWLDVTPPTLANVGMVTDATWVDIDKDKDKDLVVVGDWMPVYIFENQYGGFNDNNVIKIPNSNGWWTRVEAADLDSDSKLDLILGNWGLNTKFSASPKKPVTMFVNDFDNNGKSEFILNWYPPLDSQRFPFPTKAELTFQLPSLKKSILKFEDYSRKTLDSLFSEDIIKKSIAYHANYLATSILWNEGNLKFMLSPLPVEAQVSPVFGIVADDLDSDGKIDLWLGGNFYGLKPQLGRHNASKGVFLKGIGNRSFKNQTATTSGINVKGEVRDAVLFKSNSFTRILVARNNDTVLLYSNTKK